MGKLLYRPRRQRIPVPDITPVVLVRCQACKRLVQELYPVRTRFGTLMVCFEDGCSSDA